MKIAIYHNLNPGGALCHLNEFVKETKNENIIDIYSPNSEVSISTSGKNYLFKIKKTKNILGHLRQILFELPKVDYSISKIIKNNSYDLILVFPCHLVQSPYILKYLKNQIGTVMYMFEESKREFYENTSFNYNSFTSRLSRLIRLPTKFIDKDNCKNADNIIVNSKYSQKILEEIYQKKGHVVYLGLKKIKPKKITVKNNKKILLIGILTKLKGYEFTLEQIKGIVKEVTIIGESKYILNLIKKMNIKVNLIRTYDEKEKNKIINENSIFIANYFNEPFGITTLEASNQNRIVLGLNEGGTKEIINNNKNGFLYPRKISYARKTLKNILKKDKITLIRTCTMDWKYMAEQILSLYHKLNNTPNE